MGRAGPGRLAAGLAGFTPPSLPVGREYSLALMRRVGSVYCVAARALDSEDYSMPKLLLVLIALIALAVGGYFLFSGPDTEDPFGNGPQADRSQDTGAGTATATAKSKGGAMAAEAGAARTEVVVARVGNGEYPEVEAALTGFKGRLLQPDGEPAGEVDVKFYRFGADSLIPTELLAGRGLGLDIDAGSTLTDEEGRFELTGVWPRAIYAARLAAETEWTTTKLIPRAPKPGEIEDLGDITLTQGAKLVGTVLDEAGKPLVGVDVRAANLPGPVTQFVPVHTFDPDGAIIVRQNGGFVIEIPSWAAELFKELPIAQTKTDAEGKYELLAVEPGPNLVTFSKVDYAGKTKPRVLVKAGEVKDLGATELGEGEELFGRVVDGANQPVPGAEVVAGKALSVPMALARNLPPTDAKGTFSGVGFERGKVLVAARRNSKSPWVVSEPTSIAEDVVIKLDSEFAVTLELVSKPGLEITAPRFVVTPGLDDGEAMVPASLGFLPQIDWSDRVERIEDSNHYRLTGFSKGRFLVQVAVPEHATAMVGLKLTATAQKKVELIASQAFDVVVQDPDGKPVHGAKLFARGEGGKWSMPKAPTLCGRSDKEGMVRVDVVSAKSAVVEAIHPRYGWSYTKVELAEKGVPTDSVLLQFERPATLIGTLTDKGRPPEPGKYMIAVMRESWRAEPRESASAGPSFVTPDADGRFTFGPARPGPYSIQAMPTIDVVSGGIFASMMRMGFSEQVSAQTVLTPGGTQSVTLEMSQADEPIEGPSARVTGTVLLNGRPAEGLVVRLWSHGRKIRSVDSSGNFDLGRLAAGKNQWNNMTIIDPDISMGRGNTLWEKRLKLTANKDLHLEIRVDTGTLVGVVRGPLGQPTVGARVAASRVQSKEDNVGASVRSLTDENGRFRIERVLAGKYSVTVNADDAKGRAEDVLVVAGVPSAEVNLQLSRTLSASGSVETSALGENVSGIQVQFQLEGENRDTHADWMTGGDSEFEVEDLTPGRYKVEIGVWYRDGDDQYSKHKRFDHQGIIVVDRDVTGLTIRPVARSEK